MLKELDFDINSKKTEMRSHYGYGGVSSPLRMSAFACLAIVASCYAKMVTVTPQDTGDVLINPGMGLVHYHYSNRLWAYGINSKPGDVDPLPGTSVVYLRVLWSDIEPMEGEFRWDVFDSVAQNWIRAGKQIAVRIICCNQTVNATPDWVREAGCKGIWFKYRSESAEPRWEPVYDDPVFIEKYSSFLKAFAARYDGNGSVAFVDIGSLGMYGEGHTGDTSKLSMSETDRLARLHIDLHKKYLPNTYLVISDDVAGSVSQSKEIPPLLEYARVNGVGFRDDSLMCGKVPWFHAWWGKAFAPTLPVVLETGHYTLCDARGRWKKERILESVEAHQASYFTFHGFPEDFRESHAEEIAAVNCRLGYRLMPVSVKFPDEVAAGTPVEIAAEWVNKGVAPCHPGGFVTWSLCDAEGNVCWSFTDEKFNLRTLAPSVGANPHPKQVVSRGHFGLSYDIPPWNDQVLADLRARGRMQETRHDLLRPGKYSLCVSVGRRDGTPVIALPLADALGRRYRIGEVTIR